jgi:hypothetical protein
MSSYKDDGVAKMITGKIKATLLKEGGLFHVYLAELFNALH